MASNTDRTLIAGLLVPFYPTMHDATSNDWHGFLNEITGLTVAMDEPNPSAFDKWRVALAEQGVPVWGITEEKKVEMKARALELIGEENDRRAREGELLIALRVEAPSK